MNRHFFAVAALSLLLALPACNHMNTTQRHAAQGAAWGAGIGAVGAATTGGCVACGAGWGAAAGAAVGAASH